MKREQRFRGSLSGQAPVSRQVCSHLSSSTRKGRPKNKGIRINSLVSYDRKIAREERNPGIFGFRTRQNKGPDPAIGNDAICQDTITFRSKPGILTLYVRFFSKDAHSPIQARQ